MENQFKERFRKMNHLELVDTFNKNLDRNGWVKSRGEFLNAIREVFRKTKHLHRTNYPQRRYSIEWFSYRKKIRINLCGQ